MSRESAKPEELPPHASIDTGVLDFTFVCDQDDPDAPAPLLSATMPLEGRLEYREG